MKIDAKHEHCVELSSRKLAGMECSSIVFFSMRFQVKKESYQDSSEIFILVPLQSVVDRGRLCFTSVIVCPKMY